MTDKPQDILASYKAELDVLRAKDHRHECACRAADTALAIYHQLKDIANGVGVPADAARLGQLRDELDECVTKAELACQVVAMRQEISERVRSGNKS